MKKRQNAFTLVELLVVIAIITILAGLLLPVLGNAVYSAKNTSCQNLIKQQALAVEMYCGENDGSYPAGETHRGLPNRLKCSEDVYGFDLRPSFREYTGTELEATVLCPLGIEPRFDVNATNQGRINSSYSYYFGQFMANGAGVHSFECDRYMVKNGQYFTLTRKPTMKFNVLMSDYVLFEGDATKKIVGTQEPPDGSDGTGGNYTNNGEGYVTDPGNFTTANYCRTDLSVKSYNSVNYYLRDKEFIASRWSGRAAYVVPAEMSR